MGDKGSVLVIQKDVNLHRGFETLLFSRTDGNWKIRLVLSSYTLRKDTQGTYNFMNPWPRYFLSSFLQATMDGPMDFQTAAEVAPASTVAVV